MWTKTHTEEKYPCEDEAEISGPLSQAKGHLDEATRRWKRQGGVPPQSLHGDHAPANTLIPNFNLQPWESINFCCFQSPSLHRSPGKPIHYPPAFLMQELDEILNENVFWWKQ